MKTTVLAFEAYRNMKAAKRAARKGWQAAEDFAGGVRTYVRKQPFKALGFVFGASLGFGAITGWLISRK